MRQSPTTAHLVTRYGESFLDRNHIDTHAVASPLGLWLLLATLAPAATGEHRRELEDVLGTDATSAASRAAALLRDQHPAVASALAVWSDPNAMSSEAWTRWNQSLDRAVERGPVPTQEAADRWASERTLGLIRQFPASLDPPTLLVLASALASKVTWQSAFEDASPEDLGGPFAAAATTALATPKDSHLVQLLDTTHAGVVAAHRATSDNGLHVLSVIADADISPARVHRAASEVAAALASRGRDGARIVSLFEQPLGAGHAWTISETTTIATGPQRKETTSAVLPAWTASADLDLTNEPGMHAASDVVSSFVRRDLLPVSLSARQVATASYRKDGFDAAAVTAMMVRNAALPMRGQVVHRHATVTFNRPYAVVALAQSQASDATTGRRVEVAGAHWDGVPVFHAWVGQPA